MTVKNTLSAYRKKRRGGQIGSWVVGILSLVLVVGGISLIVISMTGGKPSTGKPRWNPFASKTPTPTNTFTPTSTYTPVPPTATPTETLTPTLTLTPTPDRPYLYTVIQGDSLYSIMEAHGLPPEAIILIYILNPYYVDKASGAVTGIDPTNPIIRTGQQIMLPNPGMIIPTSTPWPKGATRIIYMVLPGDSLGLIASKFNTTIDEIVRLNKTALPKGVATIIYPGMLLTIPVDKYTPQPTFTPTETPSVTP
jgi:LysM repeat protein